MVKTIKEEKLKWVLPIVRKETKLVEVAKVCPHSKRSLERWVALYKSFGEAGLEPKSTEPKTQTKGYCTPFPRQLILSLELYCI